MHFIDMAMSIFILYGNGKYEKDLGSSNLTTLTFGMLEDFVTEMKG